MPEPSPADGDPYAEIAAWYDLEHDPLSEDIECYLALLAATFAPHADVLEIGSGSGRIAAALALAGYHVTGVEPSAAMRARAVRRLSALPERAVRHLRLREGNANQPALEAADRFDLLLFGCNTFAHVLTAQARAQALATMRGALRTGGALVLDLDLAGPQRMLETAGQLWLSGTWPLREGAGLVAHFTTAIPTGEPGLLQLTHLYDVWEQGGPVRRTLTRMTLAQLEPAEVERALERAGYAISARYGGYDLSPLDDDAPRAILVATLA